MSPVEWGVHQMVDFEVAFQGPPRDDEVGRCLKPLPLDLTLRTLGLLGAILHNSRQALSKDLQLNFLDQLQSRLPYFRRARRALVRETSAVFLHPEQIAVLNKFAILHCAGSSVPSNWHDLFLRALLAYNYFLGRELHPEGDANPLRMGDERRATFLKAELHGLFHQHERVQNLIYRYSEFLSLTESETARSSANYLAVKAQFAELMGMPFEEYLAAIYALLGYFSQIRRVGAEPFLEYKAYIRTLPHSGAFERWIQMHSQTIEQFQADLRDDQADLFSGPSVLAFLKRPLLRLSDTVLHCPYIGNIENEFGSGLYFKLWEAYTRLGGGERFPRLFSEFFECHIVRTVERISQIAGLKYSAEKRFKGGKKSTDVVIFERPRVIFVEVVATRINYPRGVADFNIEIIKRDLKNMVIDKAKELHDNILAFRNGEFCFEGHDRHHYAKVYPVIVTSYRLPGLLAVPEYIREQLRHAGYLQDTYPLQILDVESFEGLENPLPDGAGLADLLTRKLEDARPADESFVNYLPYHEPIVKLQVSDYLKSSYHKTYLSMLEGLEQWGMDTAGLRSIG